MEEKAIGKEEWKRRFQEGQERRAKIQEGKTVGKDVIEEQFMGEQFRGEKFVTEQLIDLLQEATAEENDYNIKHYNLEQKISISKQQQANEMLNFENLIKQNDLGWTPEEIENAKNSILQRYEQEISSLEAEKAELNKELLKFFFLLIKL